MLEATTCTKIYGQQQLGKSWCVAGSRPTWPTGSGTEARNCHWTLAKEGLESVFPVLAKRRLYTLYSDGE